MLTWGRHAGKPFADVPTSYLGWLTRRRRLDGAMRRLAEDELLRRIHEPTFRKGAFAAPRDGKVGVAKKTPSGVPNRTPARTPPSWEPLTMDSANFVLPLSRHKGKRLKELDDRLLNSLYGAYSMQRKHSRVAATLRFEIERRKENAE